MRPLFVSWSWLSVLLTAAYTNQLTAILVTPQYEQKAQSVKQFVAKGYHWGNPQLPVSYQICDHQICDEWLGSRFLREKNVEERNLRMSQGNYIVPGESYGKFFYFSFSQHMPDPEVVKNYEVAGRCFAVFYTGQLFPIGSPFSRVFNKVVDYLRTTCGQVEIGLQGMFGPWEPVLGAHVQSLCEALDLPHIEARLDLDQGHREFSINLHPSQNHLNAAVKDLITFLNWTRVAIVYEEDYGLFKLQELVKSPPGSRTEMYIRQANPNSYRHVLREIRQKEIFKLIVDTNPANMNLFFRAILQLQMNDYRYHYMFTTFDIETFDLEDFKYNSVNMTAFRLVDVENVKVADLLHQMEKFQPIGHAILNRSGIIKVRFNIASLVSHLSNVLSTVNFL
ncbi:hypothetical protein GE061_016484 [Apolygus lucorum]|uniref:Receptor ligand binding region domain-containing protein n=1 Tax=Apolygus lucorum TaxID=248454 RepID=A0A8S9XHK3_APOLU|nr:hypothetical protein GE061_016484 [Apolygus lucorum]